LQDSVGPTHLQAELWQDWLYGHFFPHAPQFELSVFSLTQLPLQFVVPDGQQMPVPELDVEQFPF